MGQVQAVLGQVGGGGGTSRASESSRVSAVKRQCRRNFALSGGHRNSHHTRTIFGGNAIQTCATSPDRKSLPSTANCARIDYSAFCGIQERLMRRSLTPLIITVLPYLSRKISPGRISGRANPLAVKPEFFVFICRITFLLKFNYGTDHHLREPTAD